MTDETGKITIVKFLHDLRSNVTAEDMQRNELRTPTDVLGLVLHDVFCPAEDHTDNSMFTVILTADGEPFVDWKLRTADEWHRELMRVDAKLAAVQLLRLFRDFQ